MAASADTLLAGVADFCRDTLPELQGAYVYVPDTKKVALPDVIVELLESFVTVDSPDFTFWQLQQRHVLIFRVGCSFMVDNRNPETAAQVLRSFQDRLTAEAVKSATLGGRVPMRSPRFQFGYTPPLAEYEDGTVGREMTWTLSVADLINVED